MNVVALVPMKAHSARVPNKNFRPFAGKPLYRWIIDSLLAVDAVTRIVINTDADEILLNNEMKQGGKIMMRKRQAELCGDFVSMNRIIENDIKAVPGDLYLMTHTTNPLLSSETIEQAVSDFLAQDVHDSLFTVTRIQSRFYRADGSAVNHDPNNLIRTQDLEPWFEENSNMYLFTRESFAATQARIGNTPMLFETPPLESVDIDDTVDWKIAEAIALYKKSSDTEKRMAE
jgi:CMP-N-acetylneuraminic acid synthetase